MTTRGLARPEFNLADRYAAESGPVLLSGIQALVRVVLDQRRLDARRGLNTGIYVTGYPGSPLGGVDREMHRERSRLEQSGVVFAAALNEELAATAVAGTQLLGQLPARRHDGVTGCWFGKNPGLDRAADAIRHANIAGTAPLGGAVAWIGDDPSAKSSTVPSTCEPMCRSLMMPLLSPGTVEELHALGLHAIALSRHAGTWCGVRIVADVADATATVDVGRAVSAIQDLTPREAGQPAVLLPPMTLDAEHDLMARRLARACEYARLAGLNRIVFEPARARLAIVASGTAFHSVLRALADIGLDERARDLHGLRLVQLAMPWPVDRAHLGELLDGVETVLVVEDKLPFVEAQIKEALYGRDGAPHVIGKADAEGAPLLPARSGIGADEVGDALARILPDVQRSGGSPRSARHLSVVAQGSAGELPLVKRTPYFCSGCPHNVSTRAKPDTLVGVGIGCHIMVALDAGHRRGTLIRMPQMGGEGAQWLGLAPFTDDPHFVQNLGDGTFHHSGSLAIRAAVAANVNLTYKLLYNDAVAMTGGQPAPGRMDIATLTRALEAEGVRRIIVTTPEPKRYRGIALASIADVCHRDLLQDAQDELARVPGVTMLIHDDMCANEKRRLRKRGQLAVAEERVWINERVCEGCGDCGEQSTCLSVQPVETEFGRKTRIHQSSCNDDRTCLKGDCPAFSVVRPAARRERSTPDVPFAVPDPVRRVPRDVLVRMPGVGGTGVVTISQILEAAAHIDGMWTAGVEQIGLAQKGGPVLSDVRIASTPIAGQLRASAGSVDVILGFDLLGAAAPETLRVADRARTLAVVNSSSPPTARMVTDPGAARLDAGACLRRLDAVTRSQENLSFDATALAQRLFADHMPANMLVLGAAFQHGCLPLSASAIEQAIRVNATSVDVNLAAFRWGRAVAADREAVMAALATPAPTASELEPRTAAIMDEFEFAPGLREAVEVRVSELIRYQDVAYARRYVDDVRRVAHVEQRCVSRDSTAVTKAYAKGLFKLMAYKDEYEVARLHLDPAERARRDAEFGAGASIELLLQPPMLRALGLRRKVRVGRWGEGVLRSLYAGRRLRGSRLDPFGHTKVRRVERQIVAEYRTAVATALRHLRPETVDGVVGIAELPDVVRGYEDIKLRNIAMFRARLARLLEELADAQQTADPESTRKALP